jgi:hypothetical protein
MYKCFKPSQSNLNTTTVLCWSNLNKLIQNRNIINYIRAQRLTWFGHIYTMPDDRLVNKLFKWKPMASRSQGRPKNRWEGDVLNDIKQ